VKTFIEWRMHQARKASVQDHTTEH
jgi:sulfate transport system permease protein